MSNMKAALFEEHGGADRLKITSVPVPRLEPGKVMVRVRAAALNGFDPMILAKIPGLNIPLPMIPTGDLAGEVVEVSADRPASALKPGDRVQIDPYIAARSGQKGGILGETLQGGACEFIAVPVENLVPIPDAVSFVEAASLPIAYGTAHRMMITKANVTKGDKVLILGASGGVGTCCLQLAKMRGAEVAVCTGSAAKGETLRKLGADHVINTGAENFVESVHKLWGRPRVFGDGGGADIVINYLGGDSWAQALRTVRREGKLLTCGATNGFGPKTDIRYIWSLEINIIGSNMWTRRDLQELLNLVAEKKIKPVISSVRPLEEIALSMQELIDRRNVGKLVLLP